MMFQIPLKLEIARWWFGPGFCKAICVIGFFLVFVFCSGEFGIVRSELKRAGGRLRVPSSRPPAVECGKTLGAHRADSV